MSITQLAFKLYTPTDPLFHRVLKQFKELIECPALVNTSFNVRGEPIVCTPKDAYRCFMGNELDLLVADRCMLHKSKQDNRLRQNYSPAFQLVIRQWS
jgi:carbamoyltransferase